MAYWKVLCYPVALNDEIQPFINSPTEVIFQGSSTLQEAKQSQMESLIRKYSQFDNQLKFGLDNSVCNFGPIPTHARSRTVRNRSTEFNFHDGR